MSWFPESKDHLPLTWWKGRPIFLSAVLAIAAAVSVILTAVIMAAYPPAVPALIFNFDNLFQHFYIWTPLTYPLLNPPTLWIVLGCYMLWVFGESVERHLGRSTFVKLLLVLLLVKPILIVLLGLAGIKGPSAAGFLAIEFGVFIAFATLYPRAQISLLIVTLEVWILAAIFVGIMALSALASRNMVELLFLAVEVAVAWGFIRHEQGALRLPAFIRSQRPTKDTRPTTSTARGSKAPAAKAKPAKTYTPDVDAILDKISREGMHSLTPEERSILDKASAELKRGQ